MAIHFHFQDVKADLGRRRQLKQWILEEITQRGKEAGEIHYIFCSDDFLLELNQRFLKHDYFTDIITFPGDQKKKIAGEMYISTDRVKENAQTHGVPFQTELYRVLIHGVLHLLGLKDSSPELKQQMRKAEDQALHRLEAGLF